MTEAVLPSKSLFRRLASLVGHALALTVILGAAGGGITALHMRATVGAPSVSTTDPLPVATRVLQPHDHYTVVDRFAGRLEAARAVHLAFERSGLVTAVLVDEGDRVESGQTIATLDSEPLKAARAGVVAQQRQVVADLALARATATRQRTLVGRGYASDQRYDEARFAVAALEARIDHLDAELRRIDIDLGKTVLTAPFAGTVAGHFLDAGAVASLGAAVIDLQETGRLHARIGVTPAAAAHLRVGQRQSLIVADRFAFATLIALRPDMETGTRTIDALFQLDDADGLVIGDIVRLEHTRRVEAVGFWLPLTALQEGEKGLWTVLTVIDGADGSRVDREAVEILHVGGNRVYGRGTLAPGAKVITGGRTRVTPGQIVHALEG